MGAAGGAKGGGMDGVIGYDPSYTGRPTLDYGQGKFTGNNPDVVVGYRDESMFGIDPTFQAENVFGNRMIMKANDYSKMRDEIFSRAQNYGWNGIQDLVKSDPTKYYDVTKNILLQQKDFYDKRGMAEYSQFSNVLKDMPTDWKDKGKLFGSYDAAVGVKKAALDAAATPTTTPGGTAAGQAGGGMGGGTSDGSLMTAAEREKKRLQGLQATDGALTLGSTSLLGS